jgi:hypothetical protein
MGSSKVQASKYNQVFSWTVCLLKMGTIGSLETSVTNYNLSRVSLQKNEDLNCTAADAWYLEICENIWNVMNYFGMEFGDGFVYNDGFCRL